ncbi:MAG: hypothetical protein ACI4C4_11855 [Lachnospiraceae bacterium]
MKLHGTFIYQGSVSRPGVKDPNKIYYEVALLEIGGMDQLRCMVDKEIYDKILPNLAPYGKCNCVFNLNPQYNTLRLVDISTAK